MLLEWAAEWRGMRMALRNIVKDWKMPPRTWKEAANQFAIIFGERFTASLN